MASSTEDVNIADTDVYLMCLVMLKNEASKDELQLALNTLLKILRNVQQHPQEEKFRKLKKANKTFKQKVWRFEGGQQFLYASGWADVDDSIVLVEDSHITAAVSSIESQIRELGPLPGTAVAAERGSASQSQSQHHSGCWSDRELSEKEKKLAEERKRRLQQIKRDKEERKRIAEQIKADRRDANTRQAQESHARHLSSEGRMRRFEDIGINLNQGGG